MRMGLLNLEMVTEFQWVLLKNIYGDFKQKPKRHLTAENMHRSGKWPKLQMFVLRCSTTMQNFEFLRSMNRAPWTKTWIFRTQILELWSPLAAKLKIIFERDPPYLGTWTILNQPWKFELCTFGRCWDPDWGNNNNNNNKLSDYSMFSQKERKHN